MRGVFVALVVLASSAAAQRYEGSDLFVVCVDVLRAHVSEGIVRSATGIAGNVFRSAGIRVQWTNGAPGYRFSRENQCTAHTPRYSVILSRTSPRANDERVLAEASIGGPITAYYHHIEACARRNRVATDVLCGYVLAHEIGHVLLRNREHSKRGIMRSSWTNEDYSRMISRGLLFDTIETAVIQSHLRSELVATASRD